MNIPIDNLDSIQKPAGTMKILAYLHDKKKATITRMIADAGLSQNSAYAALENLKEKELVCVEKSEGFPVCKYYSLTERGETVAKQLGIVALILNRE